jgi:hypothetical protein
MNEINESYKLKGWYWSKVFIPDPFDDFDLFNRTSFVIREKVGPDVEEVEPSNFSFFL